jgi:hypothetical protein
MQETKDQIAINELQQMLQESYTVDNNETTADLIYIPKTENEYLIKNYIDFVNQGISISNFDTGTVPDSQMTEKKAVENM